MSAAEENMLTESVSDDILEYTTAIARENSWEKNSRSVFYEIGRERFDPSVKNHLEIYKKFLDNKSWGPTGCPFALEWPYETIPGMIHDKIVRQWLDFVIKNIKI